MPNPYDVERTWPDYSLEHRKLFEPEAQQTYRCGDLPVWVVHTLLGYIGNSTIIEGDDGLIVYETGISDEAGAHIAAEIAKISDKPIKAIFYSHHYNGTGSIVDAAAVGAGEVTIYAWENFETERANDWGEIINRQVTGVAYCGGGFLPPEEKHHHGIELRISGGTAAHIPPTATLSGGTNWEWNSASHHSPDELLALSRLSVERSQQLIDDAIADGGLDRLVKRGWPDGRAPSLRVILVHLIEEYARQKGHADLLREPVDGATGE